MDAAVPDCPGPAGLSAKPFLSLLGLAQGERTGQVAMFWPESPSCGGGDAPSPPSGTYARHSPLRGLIPRKQVLAMGAAEGGM